MQHRFKCLLALMLSGVVSFANATSVSSRPVLLYMQPDVQSRLIAKLNPSTRLVPIYEQKNWLKVGDPSNGEVGWLNKDQYMQALQDAMKAHTQTFVFKADDQAGGAPKILAYHNGHPLDEKKISKYSDNIVVQYSKAAGQDQPKIVAYENGKKLSTEASKALLDRMQVERATMQQHFDHMQQNMQRMFRKSMEDFQEMDDDLIVPSRPILLPLEPGPVIQSPKKMKAITKPVSANKQPSVPNPFKSSGLQK